MLFRYKIVLGKNDCLIVVLLEIKRVNFLCKFGFYVIKLFLVYFRFW